MTNIIYISLYIKIYKNLFCLDFFKLNMALSNNEKVNLHILIINLSLYCQNYIFILFALDRSNQICQRISSKLL